MSDYSEIIALAVSEWLTTPGLGKCAFGELTAHLLPAGTILAHEILGECVGRFNAVDNCFGEDDKYLSYFTDADFAAVLEFAEAIAARTPLAKADAVKNDLYISAHWVGNDDEDAKWYICCRCLKERACHPGSDGHLYCERCRILLQQEGSAFFGGFYGIAATPPEHEGHCPRYTLTGPNEAGPLEGVIEKGAIAA